MRDTILVDAFTSPLPLFVHPLLRVWGHPSPFDIATALYQSGSDSFTGEEVYVAKGLRDRKMQRALMQFFKPQNDFMVRDALLKAGRADLIGNGCDCLIPARPPKAAIEARRRKAKGE